MLKVDKDKVFWRKIGGETLISHTDTGLTYSLGETAAILWEGIADGQPLETIIASLVEIYGIDEPTARGDVEELLVDLKKEGLIR